MKIKKKLNLFFFLGGGGVVGVGWGGGVRLDVDEELNFFVKIQKKKLCGGRCEKIISFFFFLGGGGGSGRGGGFRGGGGGGGGGSSP